MEYQKVKVYRSRDVFGRFVSKGIKQSDVPEQCYLCKNNVHKKCNEPDDCGCECALFIEVITNGDQLMLEKDRITVKEKNYGSECVCNHRKGVHFINLDTGEETCNGYGEKCFCFKYKLRKVS